MNRRRKVSSIIVYVMLIIFSLSTLIFAACNKNETQSTNIEDVPQSTTISLDLKNYNEYFTLQEEIISYKQTDYTKVVEGAEFYMTKVNQTTKLSVILLKEDIKFNNVIISIVNDTKTGAISSTTGAYEYSWSGDGGKLNLSYNGSGFLTLTSAYDGPASDLSRHPMKYKISKIEGTISVQI